MMVMSLTGQSRPPLQWCSVPGADSMMAMYIYRHIIWRERGEVEERQPDRDTEISRQTDRETEISRQADRNDHLLTRDRQTEIMST